MQSNQEWMTLLVGSLEDTLLRARACYFIVLDDELFLKDFDGVETLGQLVLGEHDLLSVSYIDSE